MTAVGHLPARVSKPEFRFRPLARADLPLLHEWINRPHVAEWWDDQRDLESVLRTFGDSPMIRMFLVYLDQDAIGYIQVYQVMGGDPEWWTEETDPGAQRARPGRGRRPSPLSGDRSVDADGPNRRGPGSHYVLRRSLENERELRMGAI